MNDDLKPEDIETAEENGIPKKNVIQRVYEYGWLVERAITEPVKKRSERHTYDPYWIGIAKENGISDTVFRWRVRVKGFSQEKAATEPIKTQHEAGKLGGKKDTIFTAAEKEILKANDIAEGTARQRVHVYGMSIEQAINQPVRKSRPYKSQQNQA